MSAISSPLSSQSSATGSTASSTSTSSGTINTPAAGLANEQTFLKLLVAQIQNQDPTSPTDPVQFVGQLTQYSELEQLININSGIQSLQPPASSTPTTTTTTPTTTTTTTAA